MSKIKQIEGANQSKLLDFVRTKKTPTYNPDYILANYQDPNYVNTLYVPEPVIQTEPPIPPINDPKI